MRILRVDLEAHLTKAISEQPLAYLYDLCNRSQYIELPHCECLCHQVVNSTQCSQYAKAKPIMAGGPEPATPQWTMLGLTGLVPDLGYMWCSYEDPTAHGVGGQPCSALLALA